MFSQDFSLIYICSFTNFIINNYFYSNVIVVDYNNPEYEYNKNIILSVLNK